MDRGCTIMQTLGRFCIVYVLFTSKIRYGLNWAGAVVEGLRGGTEIRRLGVRGLGL